MQVLVHVSTYQGPFWYRFFEPQPLFDQNNQKGPLCLSQSGLRHHHLLLDLITGPQSQSGNWRIPTGRETGRVFSRKARVFPQNDH